MSWDAAKEDMSLFWLACLIPQLVAMVWHCHFGLHSQVLLFKSHLTGSAGLLSKIALPLLDRWIPSLFPKILFGKPSAFEVFQRRFWLTMSQRLKIKRTKYHFKLRILKDTDCCNSNSKGYYDLREQVFTLGEINIMFQVDSNNHQWSGQVRYFYMNCMGPLFSL